MKYYLQIILTLSVLFGTAQTDIIRIATYNILNYRNFSSFCTASNNNPVTKEQNLHTILQYLQPDLMVCNEIGGNSAQPVDLLLTNAFNTNGVTKYAKAQFANNSFSSLVNMVYYNTDKLVLHGQFWINKDLNNNDLVRIIDVYRFYYKDSLLNAQSDTVFFTILAAHLKAGNSSSDVIQRDLATAAVMSYVQNSVVDDNVFMMGDLNTYKSQEQCYQNLINYSVPALRFEDPISTPGTWNNNSTYAAVHTQSTHSSGGCFSGGGLDDRFDHILVSAAVMNNDDKVEYVKNTYQAIGNDGQHFNTSINNGPNSSVPANVLSALYDLSDHLPVALELRIKLNGIGVEETLLTRGDLIFENPASSTISLIVRSEFLDGGSCFLTDLSGRTILTVPLQKMCKQLTCEFNIAQLKKGSYFLTVIGDNGESATQKVIIN